MEKIRTMLKNRRVLCALAGGMLMLALCACGGGDDTAASTPPVEEPSPSAAVSAKPTSTPAPSSAPTPTPTPAADQGRPAKVTAKGGLNLRSAPGTKNKSLLVIPSGAQVKVFQEKDGWAEVEYDGKNGWCSMEYLDIQPATP